MESGVLPLSYFVQWGNNMFKTTNKQLERKQKIIDRLIQENNDLRSQIAELDPEVVQKKLELTENTRKEYEKLIDELKLLKEEYEEINRQIEIEKRALIKELKKIY